MGLKLYPETAVINLANAIRSAYGGISTSYRVSDMASAILNIPSSSESGPLNVELTLSILNGTVSGVVSDSTNIIYQIAPYAFHKCSYITGADFPICTSIGSYAFGAYYYYNSVTTRLSYVSFPVCTSIGDGAFYQCSSLTSVDFPLCVFIGSDAFGNCYSLSSISFPVCTSIDEDAFAICSSLTSVSFPSCTFIGNYTFSSCTNLVSISFPACTSIDYAAFSNCYKLESAYFPVCSIVERYTFTKCSSLSTASFPSCIMIGSQAFYSCYNLLALYLMGSSVCSLVNINAFQSTPISNYTTSTGGVYGSIYVPASLLANYKTATNWVTYSNRMVGVS